MHNALNNAAESFGENDKRTKNWQIQLNNAQAELKDNKTILEKTDEIIFCIIH